MALSAQHLEFVSANPAAAMVTVGADGRPRVARVAVGVIDGELLSSGTQARVRTRRLRHDPRCTLYVHGADWSWLALETNVTILDGPEAPAETLRLFRSMQGRPDGPLDWFGQRYEPEAFVRLMADEGRLI